MKATRQRRKLILGDKTKNSEKYPLASARVIVDFKLRIVKGCKVSKLRLKEKLKSYILKNAVGKKPLSLKEVEVSTLQLYIRAEGDQHVKPAIVFRGKGQNVLSASKTLHDQDVDVHF